MKKSVKKIVSHDMPIGKLSLISDFLPPPKALLPKEHTIKITLKIDEPTVRFFKGEANKNKTKYQRMMREVLSIYAKKYGIGDK